MRSHIWIAVGFACFVVLVPFSFSSTYIIGLCALACMYAAINLMWSLVIGTAGLPSFATMAIVGIAGYVAARISLSLHAGWPVMLLAGGAVGALTGLLIALPAIRLRGIYFMLLTLGLVQVCSSFISQSDLFGRQQGLFGTAGIVPDSVAKGLPSARVGFYAAAVLLALALATHFLVARGPLGRRLRVARENEPFAQALGIGIVRDRMLVFLISSAGLGVIGGFYTAFYRSVSPSLLSFELGLLLLAMIVLGGMESAWGIVAGTALVVVIDAWFVEWGPLRLVLVGVVMLLVTLVAKKGIAGLAESLWAWSDVDDEVDSTGTTAAGSAPTERPVRPARQETS